MHRRGRFRVLRQPRLNAGINHLIFEVKPTIIEHVNALALDIEVGFVRLFILQLVHRRTRGFGVSGLAGKGEEK